MTTTERAAGKAWVAIEKLTVDTGAYESGDLIGGKITIDPPSPASIGNGVLIQSVVITDLAGQEAEIDVMFFDGDPANTTFTDNAAFDPNDADLENFGAGIATVDDWHSFNDSSLGQALRLAIPIVPEEEVGTFYAVLISRGTPTFGASDLTLRIEMVVL